MITNYSISDKEFRLFHALIHERTGIFLNDSKRLLLISRLSKRLRALDLANFSEYYDFVQNSSEGPTEMVNLINQVTTNKTDFFRERHHFDLLRGVVFPNMIARNYRNVRIWSAAASTGEEPYSLAMEVAAAFSKRPGYDVKILATDLDTTVLDHARLGEYNRERVEPVPREYQKAYLTQLPTGKVRVADGLKRYLTFKKFNLMHSFPFKQGFDVVFCRNVIIYFSREDKLRVIEKIHGVLRPGGYLCLGHSESLLADSLGFKNLGNTIYQKT